MHTRWRRRWRRFARPTAEGLPSIGIVALVPVLALVLGIVGVATGLNGWSSGAMAAYVSAEDDPQLIAGVPREIRTDEWYVQTVWAIAQVEQGLPAVNRTFPDGGMDATIPQDLPRNDLSVAFRPHLWGFLFLDTDRAFAFKWWALVVAMLSAIWVLAIHVLPRRPIVAALLTTGFYFSPFFQWWFLATTIWPVVWAAVAMVAVMVALRSPSRVARWLWATLAGFLAVVVAMGIYVPFIVPVALVVVAFGIGAIATWHRLRARTIAARLVPLAVAHLAGGVVVASWLLGRQETVAAFLSTAYPGERLTPTGSAGLLDAASVLASSFSGSLMDHGGLLGLNSSEASTFFLFGIFSVPVAVWSIIRLRRRGRPLPWVLVAMIGVTLVFLAFMFVPGWDAVAHLLGLDRTIPGRVRIGLGLASLVTVLFLVRTLDEYRVRAPWPVALLGAAGFLLTQLALAVALGIVVPESLAAAWTWWILAAVGTAALILLARRRVALAAALFCLVGVVGGAGVNPWYLGVYDLRDTAVSMAVTEVDHDRPGTWVGVGGRLTTAVLLESGVEAYNGFQGAPSAEMWDDIDPDEEYAYEWNRLAGVSWTSGTGEPVVSNPAPDQILVSFDSCAPFAQSRVDYVLSDDPALAGSPCLKRDAGFRTAEGTLTVYEVVPRP
jgi:hypothetical protein